MSLKLKYDISGGFFETFGVANLGVLLCDFPHSELSKNCGKLILRFLFLRNIDFSPTVIWLIVQS
jgi:hypothetical protein